MRLIYHIFNRRGKLQFRFSVKRTTAFFERGMTRHTGLNTRDWLESFEICLFLDDYKTWAQAAVSTLLCQGLSGLPAFIAFQRNQFVKELVMRLAVLIEFFDLGLEQGYFLLNYSLILIDDVVKVGFSSLLNHRVEIPLVYPFLRCFWKGLVSDDLNLIVGFIILLSYLNCALVFRHIGFHALLKIGFVLSDFIWSEIMFAHWAYALKAAQGRFHVLISSFLVCRTRLCFINELLVYFVGWRGSLAHVNGLSQARWGVSFHA